MSTDLGLLRRVAGLSSDTSAASRQEMRELTREIAELRVSAIDEYRRYLAVQGRGLPVGEHLLADALRGTTILVTGGTGCVGSVLLRQLTAYRPTRLVSVSRGATMPAYRSPEVTYLWGDVRDRRRMEAVFGDVRPNVVFHLAAVRDPGYAERYPRTAIETNVLGTRVVLDAAANAGCASFVYASTGKAVRYYTRDVYAATKKVAEVLLRSADPRLRVSATRFTHIVDNSIVHRRMKHFIDDDLLTLHGPDVAFYAQSAREAAQLLTLAATPGVLDDAIYSQFELGLYFDLVDIALGMRASMASDAPLAFVGFSAGYGATSHPAQYDPLTFNDAGPLINAVEAACARPAGCEGVCAIPIRRQGGSEPEAVAAEFCEALEDGTASADAVGELDFTGRAILADTFVDCPAGFLDRLRRIARHHPTSGDVDKTIDAALWPPQATGPR